MIIINKERTVPSLTDADVDKFIKEISVYVAQNNGKEVVDDRLLIEEQQQEYQYKKMLRKVPQRGRINCLKKRYYNYIAQLPPVFDYLYHSPSDKRYNISKIMGFLFKEYDTKMLLCGKTVRVYKHPYFDIAIRYDFDKGRVRKFHNDNDWNKQNKVLTLAYANEDILRSFITLTFDEKYSMKDINRFWRNWSKKMNRKTNNTFEYIKVFETRTKKIPRPHFHLLTTLDIDVNGDMFIKSSKKNPKYDEYNLDKGIWKHGWTTAYRINSTKDLTNISLYNSKYIDIERFADMRNWSASEGIIRPRVLYYDSRCDQRKINNAIKGATAVHISTYPDKLGREIVETKYSRDPSATPLTITVGMAIDEEDKQYKNNFNKISSNL